MKKILIIDDNWLIRENLKDFLHETFILEIESASSVQESIDNYRMESFDLILCDYEMPEDKGDRFLSHLREHGLKTPLIFFTGNYELDIKVESPLVATVTQKDFLKLMAAIEATAIFKLKT